MVGFIKWCIIFVVILGALIGAEPVEADAQQEWGGRTPSLIRRIPTAMPTSDAATCSGEMLPIVIDGVTGVVDACVFGEPAGVRLARYRNAEASLRYAVSYKLDVKFFTIRDFCTGMAWCVYGQGADVALTPSQIIRHFTQYLTKHNDGAAGYYQFEYSDAVEQLQAGPTILSIGSMAVSARGDWAVVEARDVGYIRLNLHTLQTKRVYPLSLTYGYGFDPLFEMAISNDGSTIAVTGRNAGIDVFEVTDECGDQLKNNMPQFFNGDTIFCKTASIDRFGLFPGFSKAEFPRFSGNGQTLAVTVSSNRGWERVLFSSEPGQSTSNPLYIAFGDSYTSGEGELSDAFYAPGTNTGQNTCHISTRSYPMLVGTFWLMPTINAACSGSKIADVQHVKDTISQIPTVISLGVGGNDADLVGKLKSCLGMDTCEWAQPGKRAATAREIKALFPKITQLIDDLRTTYVGTPIVLVGYPSVINSQADSHCGALVGALLDRDERQFMNESITYLNHVMKAAAQYESIQFVDIQEALNGERLCDEQADAMNGIRIGDDIAPLSFLENIKVIGAESFHPTPRGHQLVAERIEATLPTPLAAMGCNGCMYEAQLLIPSNYWNEPEASDTSLFQQVAQLFTDTQAFLPSGKVSIAFEPGTFLGLTTLKVEIHSTPVEVGSLQTKEDGSVTGSVTLPPLVAGYHVLHVFGESASGQLVDVYQTVFIAPPHNTNENVAAAPLIYSTNSGNKNDPTRGVRSPLSPITTNFTQGSTEVLGANAFRGELHGSEERRPKAEGVNRLSVIAWPLFMLAIGIMAYMSIRKVVKSVIPTTLFKRIEPAGHLIESMIVSTLYGFPGRKLRVIGVTGTNGKTTTSFFIQRMLSEAGVSTGLTSTVAYGLDKDIHRQVEHITTAKASILQSRLKQFAKKGAEWVVVETSSHSLAQNRVWGIPYEIAVLTNLTHDHLDYHGSFDNYREAKRKLFRIANKHGLRFGVVNADDPSAKAFSDTVENSTTYGIKAGDVTASNIKLTSTGSTYTAKAGDDVYEISIQIPGEFNVYNSLAALSVGRKLGLTKEQIEKGLGALESVEGRMNAIDEGQKFKVLVDFASTPDGFEKFFSSVRPLVKGKLIAVFGSAGRRDESKRAEQGRIAGRYADVVIATEEDDRDDDGEKILRQISEGAMESGKTDGKTLFRISNREEAIGFALTQAATVDDMVVLLGKGHEKTIERADGEYPWNESDVARAALQELLKK